jgi:uncharacterized protein YaiL (DUF2058 family)
VKQDLRDKLLKAGLVDKKTKKRADHRARIKRTEAKKKGVDEEKEEEKKAREYEEKEEKRRRQDKERERARQQKQLKRDKKYQALDVLQARMFLPKSSGPVAFHFVSRSGGIRKLQVTTGIARDLDNGQLAIAQLPGGERFGLVRRDVAEQLLADDPSLVRFFVKDQKEDMVEAPPVVEDAPPRKKTTKKFEPPGKNRGDRRDR